MADLDVIIPVRNEATTVEELAVRIEATLSSAGIDYNVIFVDDYSTDNTAEKIRNHISHLNSYVNGELRTSPNSFSEKVIYEANEGIGESNGSRLKLLRKKGKQGKAYSILEGVKASSAPYIAMIDGDLQYPPEAIPRMYKLAQNHGVVVANRQMNGGSTLRKIGSKINNFLLGKAVLGFDCDVQSGLKVFRKEIVDYVREEEVTPWTIDMNILRVAKDFGYQIDSVDIDYFERRNGESKIRFLRDSWEIVLASLKTRRKRRVYTFNDKDGRAIGAGLVHKGKKFVTHTVLDTKKSALVTLEPSQKSIFILAAAILALGLFFDWRLTIIYVVGALSSLFFIDFLFTFYLLVKRLRRPSEITFSKEALGKLSKHRLPIYTILCPLYKEAGILPQFVEAIGRIEWPKDKLDVLLLLEEDDRQTIQAAQRLKLPSYFRTFIVPHSEPKTKPKACNYGLAHAKGEYVVIYDAEDKPDPLQLKKAYYAFTKKVPSTVVCLQSKLNYYNKDQNLLTRLFTAEYSLWFDLVLPGLQLLNTNIPLGGTSNHFKTRVLRYLDGWDPFNVTEDCDLGVRLFRAGFSTAIIDSTTYEEANSRVKNWLKQRSRWIKGYLQTYFVHNRNFIEFIRTRGLHAFLFQLVIGARMIFMMVNPLLWLITISYFAFRASLGPTIESFYPIPVFYLALIPMVFGNFIYLFNYMIACAKRGHWELIKYVFFIPFYWALASAASFIALYQLIVKPHYWEKTKHGLHLIKPKQILPEVKIAVDFDFGLKGGFISRIPSLVSSAILVILRNIFEKN